MSIGPLRLTVIATATLLVAGCNQKLPEDNDRSFSFAGISLGDSKAEVESSINFDHCVSKTADQASCFFKNEKSNYAFFGKKTSSQTAKFYDPYQNLDGISIYFRSGSIRRETIENRWQLDGKCLDGFGVSDVREKSDNLAAKMIISEMRQYSVIPYTNDFICLQGDRKFIRVSNYDNGGGAVEMYYLKENFVYLLQQVIGAKADLVEAEKRQRMMLKSSSGTSSR